MSASPVSRKVVLREMVEQRTTVTKHALEFDYEFADPYNDGTTRLRVTVDADGLRVRDLWDPTTIEWAARWEQIADAVHVDAERRRWAEEERLDREAIREMEREARCVIAIRRRGARPWPAPDCVREIACLGPNPAGLRARCDESSFQAAWGLQ